MTSIIFMKVYTYAKTIAESENVSEKDLITVETAAIVHDIACPLCREKYGNTNGKYQEKEGILLAEEFHKRHRSAGRNQETGCFSGGTSSHLNRY